MMHRMGHCSMLWPLVLSIILQPASALDRLTAIAVLEQGFSSIKDRNRAPLTVPFSWITAACVISDSESASATASAFLDLLSRTVGKQITLLKSTSVAACDDRANFFIRLTGTRADVKRDMIYINGLVPRESAESIDLENFPSGLALWSAESYAYAWTDWDDGRPAELNWATMIEEVFQAFSGGQDVQWGGSFFSILQEVGNDEGLYSGIHDVSRLERNARGLCKVDVFALVALTTYLNRTKTDEFGTNWTSGGLLDYTNIEFERILRGADNVAIPWRASGFMDPRCQL